VEQIDAVQYYTSTRRLGAKIRPWRAGILERRLVPQVVPNGNEYPAPWRSDKAITSSHTHHTHCRKLPAIWRNNETNTPSIWKPFEANSGWQLWEVEPCLDEPPTRELTLHPRGQNLRENQQVSAFVCVRGFDGGIPGMAFPYQRGDELTTPCVAVPGGEGETQGDNSEGV
jgi:hypothetical protein